MKLITKTDDKMVLTSEMDISLANAIRRSVNEIPIIAVDEVDIYKNDSALYDEVIALRIGLIPLKNQKLKSGETISLKLKSSGKEDGTEVLSGELGEEVVYDKMPIVLLGKNQELELVARARHGTGKEHAKFSPGLIYYKHMPKIKITKDGEKNQELAVLYPEVFEFDEKLKVKNAWRCELEQEDVDKFKGIEISFDDELVFVIESWGQIDAREMFLEACKALKSSLTDVAKVLK